MRAVPDGNISAYIKSGFLTITGDSLANRFELASVGDRSITISPLDTSTTVNGVLGPVTLEKVRNLEINTGGGDDVVMLTAINVRSLAVDLGDGNDVIVLNGVNVGKSAAILGNSGDDQVQLLDTTIHRILRIDLGDGDDLVAVTGSRTGKDSQYNGGAGTDFIVANEISVGRNFQIYNFEEPREDQPPVAQPDESSVDEGGAINIAVAANDMAVQGTLDLGSVRLVRAPAFGTAVVNPDGSVSYAHDGSETTSDSFSYLIDDSNGNSSDVTEVTIVVNPVNDVPTAVNDAATLNEGAAVNVAVADNDFDPEGQLDLSAINVTVAPANGTFTISPSGVLTYTHDGSETTTDSLRYTIRDASGAASNEATVEFTILPVNDAPTAVNDAATLNEGAAINVAVANNDNDPEGQLDASSIVITSAPANGSASVDANGILTYTHNGSETTTDTLRYTIRDAAGALSNEATVDFTIVPVNDPPVATNDNGVVFFFGSAQFNLANNDTDVDSALNLASILIESGPQFGAVVVNADGTVNYQHTNGQSLADSFTYSIADASGLRSNIATVFVTVEFGGD